MTTSARRERSDWCQQWIRSLGGQPERPPDRHERLKEALAERNVPYSQGIEHVDEVLPAVHLEARGDQYSFEIAGNLAASSDA